MKTLLVVALALLGDVEAIKQRFPYHPIGVRFIQQRSDPIHGSLGPKGVDYELSDEDKLEQHLNSLKPREWVLDPEVFDDTMDSIAEAEKLQGAKMEEPHDIEARKAASPWELANAPTYKLHNSDDEDEETIETRKSLRSAERMYKTRFFTDRSQLNRFNLLDKEKKLRKEVKEFKETGNHEIEHTADQVKAREERRATDPWFSHYDKNVKEAEALRADAEKKYPSIELEAKKKGDEKKGTFKEEVEKKK